MGNSNTGPSTKLAQDYRVLTAAEMLNIRFPKSYPQMAQMTQIAGQWPVFHAAKSTAGGPSASSADKMSATIRSRG
jgi:hypothetical protein